MMLSVSPLVLSPLPLSTIRISQEPGSKVWLQRERMALANDRLRLKVGIQHDNFSMSPRVCTRRAPSVGMLGREQGDYNVDILAAFTYIYSTTMRKVMSVPSTLAPTAIGAADFPTDQ